MSNSLTQYIGDDRVYTLPLKTPEGAAFNPTGHILIFTAKRSKTDLDPAAVFQKVTGAGIVHSGTNAVLTILRADTVDLGPWDLYCDVRAQNLETGLSDVVWEDGRLILERGTTRETTTSTPVNSESSPLPASATAAFDGAADVEAADIVGTEQVLLKSTGLQKIELDELKAWILAGVNLDITAETLLTTLGVPSYASLSAANVALTIGKIFFNTTSQTLEITTA